MAGRTVRYAIALSTVVLAVMGALTAGPAGAGVGTFTRITTPSRDLLFRVTASGTGHLRVAGAASRDVTQVDIDCVVTVSGQRQSSKLLAAVPVSSGRFDALVPIAGRLVPCRLRAVPTGVNADTAYLASFSGPVLRVAGVVKQLAAGTTIGYQAFTAAGTGFAATADASQCPSSLLATIETPAMDVRGGGERPACTVSLPAGNARNTGSAIRIDGHDAYLPYGVAKYLNGFLHLGVPASSLSVGSRLAGNGELRIVEVAKLRRCSGTNPDTYPPTSTSCSTLVDTGVTFRRVVDIFRGVHQVRIRDTFLGTDGHAHSLRLEYFSGFGGQSSGATGYLVPRRPGAFRRVSPGQRFNGLGTRADTLYVRSDVYAAGDDPDADTYGYTWSRGPQQLQIDPVDTTGFELPYALHVAAHGRADLGFAWTEHVATRDARALALVAQREMVNRPHVSRPRDHAVIAGRSTTVRGYVTIGANGLPTHVAVKGHAARLTRVSASTVRFTVRFKESLGRHVLHVTATDVAGNTQTATIHVRNR